MLLYKKFWRGWSGWGLLLLFDLNNNQQTDDHTILLYPPPPPPPKKSPRTTWEIIHFFLTLELALHYTQDGQLLC